MAAELNRAAVADRDFYQLLGVPASASQEQIKAAFRRLAIRFHPDHNPDTPDATERFKRINEAYAVLSDPERRIAHDREREPRSMQDLARDLLGDLMGGRVHRADGADLRVDVTLTLREATEGARRSISFAVNEPCAACEGIGGAPGATVRCAECDGRGEVKEGRGFLALSHPCAGCGGRGVRVTKACPRCGGVGTVEAERRFEVKIPAGARDGDVKILEGEGEPGLGGGRSGDLHIVIEVTSHPLLRQQGDDLSLELPVSLATAALGGIVEVPTLEAPVRMKVPAGTQSGRVFRLRGKGLWGRSGGRGDLLVQLDVETPVALSDEARQLLQAFDAACGPESHPRRQRVYGAEDDES